MEVKAYLTSSVRAGYKKTEVGVIPEDWEVKPIGDFSTIKTGPFGTLLKASEYSKSHGVPLISVGEVREGFLRISEDTPRVSTQVTKRLPQYVLKEGDIVFGRKGGVERSALIKAPQDGWFLGSDGISIRPSSKLSAPYLGLQFQSHRVKEWLLQNAIGTTMASLNQAILKNALVPLPPAKAEQEAIAEALSDADAWIESLEQLIQKKRRIKEGTMQELLTGKRRLPGFEGEWEEKMLIELAGHKRELFNDGDWVEAEHITTEGVRLVQTGNIGEGKFIDRAEKKYIYEKSFYYLRCKELRAGDLLICRLADPAGRACVLPCLEDEKVITSVDVTICRFPPEQANRTYLANLFSTGEWFRAVSDRSGGTTHKRIARGALGRIPLLLPKSDEQTAIAEVLSDMDAEIEALEAKLAKARQIKQGMMQELLTGKTRLV